VKTLLGVLAALALVGVIVFTVVGSAPRIEELRGGSQGQSPQAASDITELAQRLIAPPFPNPDGTIQSATLIPSALPKDAPFDMPVPPNGRVVGSVLRQRGTSMSFDVVLDVTGKADEITSFYERELGSKGFNPPPTFQQPQQGGFVSSIGPASGKMFCKADVGPYVSVTVFGKASGPNDVRTHYEPANPNQGTPCSQKGGPGGPPATRLPALRPPDGVTLQGSGGGFGGNRQSSDATALTSKGVGELESYFAQQLVAAGWTRINGKADGPIAWSTWKVPGDGDWQGLLLIIESPGKDRRSLTLRAESPTGF
jgi:hypothetical protein